jgi:dynein heavy chain
VLPVELLRIWIHENTRVFGDRMINEGDRNFLQTLMLEKSIQHFGVKKELIFNAERLLFTDFMEGIDVDVRIYRQIEDLKKF